MLGYNFISLHPEDGGSLDLRNVGILPQHYTASQPRRRGLESTVLKNEDMIKTYFILDTK